MIDIKIERDGNAIMLSAIGHADFAEYGSDIVCAGVSSVILGLCSALNSKSSESRISSGCAIVRALFNRESKCYFRFAEKALSLIAANYPENVRFSVNNNTRKA